MAASHISVEQQLEDITECPICTEPFDDPRSLPCIHAFCFKCIASYCKDRGAGDQVLCPICRKLFTVPDEGMSGLPKNFFIGKLMQINCPNGETARTSDLCDACKFEASTESVNSTATIFCVDCQEKLCDDCARDHKKFKAFRSHKQVPLENYDKLKHEQVACSGSPRSMCDKHKDQALGFFCSNCKMAICVICYVTSHKDHQCLDVNDVDDRFRRQLTAYVDSLLDGIEKLRKIQESVEKQKQCFEERVAETEISIQTAAEETKMKVERDKQALLDRLTTRKCEVVKQFDNLTIEITQQLSFMDSLKTYCDELSNKGAVGDVARESSVLQTRVNDLLKFDVFEQSRNKLHSTDVDFAAAKSEGNLLGEVSVTAKEKGQ